MPAEPRTWCAGGTPTPALVSPGTQAKGPLLFLGTPLVRAILGDKTVSAEAEASNRQSLRKGVAYGAWDDIFAGFATSLSAPSPVQYYSLAYDREFHESGREGLSMAPSTVRAARLCSEGKGGEHWRLRTALREREYACACPSRASASSHLPPRPRALPRLCRLLGLLLAQVVLHFKESKLAAHLHRAHNWSHAHRCSPDALKASCFASGVLCSGAAFQACAPDGNAQRAYERGSCSTRKQLIPGDP